MGNDYLHRPLPHSDGLGQRRAEQALRESEEVLRQLTDTIQHVFWVRDVHTRRIIYASPGYERVWGRPVQELYDRPESFFDSVLDEDKPRVMEAVQGLANGSDFDEEFRMVRPDGQVRWIWARTFPIHNERGEVYRVAGVAEDITERKAFEELLARSEETASALINAPTDSAVLLEADGTIAAINEIGAERFGMSPEQMVGRSMADFMEPDLVESRSRHLNTVLQTGRPQRFHDVRGGRHYDLNIYPVRNARGEVDRVAVFGRDITRQVKDQQKLQLMAQVFQASKEAIMITKPDGTIVDVNQAFCDITGFSRSEALGETPRIMKSGMHDDEFYHAMWTSLRETGEWQGEIWDRRKSGEPYPKWLSISSVQDDAGRITHYVAIFTDITDMKAHEHNLEQLAHYDHLTGLPNRYLFHDRLEQAIMLGKRHGEKTGLLFLDLDGFKHINDTLGHRAGDELLQAVARRLQNCVRRSDTVARLGGDEFTVILTGAKDTETIAETARKILAAFADPFELEAERMFVTASIGVAVAPLDGDQPDVMTRHADTAMYYAKAQGKNTYRFFDPEMDARAQTRFAMEAGLRRALENQDLDLAFQPRVDLRTGAVTGVEALVRLRRENAVVLPEQFISLAEDSGLIHLLDRWVLDRAAAFAARLHARFGPLPVAVNLSDRHFSSHDIVGHIQAALVENRLDPRALEIDITERTVSQHDTDRVEVLQRISGLGVRLCLDDFGAGHSSLGSLKAIPASLVKIDRGFVRDTPDDPTSVAICRAVVDLTRALGVEAVAVGVETARQADFFRSLGCGHAQGFRFHQPLAEAELHSLLNKGQRPSHSA